MEKRDLVRVDQIGRLGTFGTTHIGDWTPAGATPATAAQGRTAALFATLNTAGTGIVARLASYGTGRQSGSAEPDYIAGPNLLHRSASEAALAYCAACCVLAATAQAYCNSRGIAFAGRILRGYFTSTRA
jgi:hypothetical protein